MASEDLRWRGLASGGDDVPMDGDHQSGRVGMTARSEGKGKRLRTQTDPNVGSAQTDDEKFFANLSDAEWGGLEDEFKKTTTMIIFSMTEELVEVEKCALKIDNFRWDILKACRDAGVLFVGNKLKVEKYSKTSEAYGRQTRSYLSGHPAQLDRALWSFLKPGFLAIKGVKIWMQPVFTGRKNTTLTLNELEYVNSNAVSYVQLLDAIRRWGGTDALIVSHNSYFDIHNIRQESRRSASDCLQVAAYSVPEMGYSFRLFFPSEDEANRVYQSFLESECAEYQHGDPTSTIMLTPVPNSEWDSSLHKMFRPDALQANDAVYKVGIFGVSIEMKATTLEQIFDENALGEVKVEIRGRRSLFAVGSCSSQQQLDAILRKYGPDGDKKLQYKNIVLYLRKWETTPPKRPCQECGAFGHRRVDCTRLTAARPRLPTSATLAMHHGSSVQREEGALAVRRFTRNEQPEEAALATRKSVSSEQRMEARLEQLVGARFESIERRFQHLDRQQHETDSALAKLSISVNAAVAGFNDRFDKLLQSLQHFGPGGQAHQ